MNEKTVYIFARDNELRIYDGADRIDMGYMNEIDSYIYEIPHDTKIIITGIIPNPDCQHIGRKRFWEKHNRPDLTTYMTGPELPPTVRYKLATKGKRRKKK